MPALPLISLSLSELTVPIFPDFAILLTVENEKYRKLSKKGLRGSHEPDVYWFIGPALTRK
jgi:hypothetical protein